MKSKLELMPEEDLVQIGGRVTEATDRRLKLASVLVGQTKQLIIQDAIAVSLGTADFEAVKRQQAVREALQEVSEGKLPF